MRMDLGHHLTHYKHLSMISKIYFIAFVYLFVFIFKEWQISGIVIILKRKWVLRKTNMLPARVYLLLTDTVKQN